MAIPITQVIDVMKKYNIQPYGVLHVGAHNCQELGDYAKCGVSAENVIWVEGNKEIAENNQKRGVPNVYHALIDEKVNEVTFHITNHDQSSSILPLGTHEKNYPYIHVVRKDVMVTTPLPLFFTTHQLDPKKYNYWVFDIQGAELRALKGAKELLQYVDIMCLEVNTEEVYQDCGLMSEIDYFLKPYGFTRELTLLTNAGWGDAVYVKIK